jgi:LAO/AO transport system kinase
LFSDSDSGWNPTVITSSTVEKRGIHETWQLIQDYLAFTNNNQYFEKNRTHQNLIWFHESIQQLLRQQLTKSGSMNEIIVTLEKEIVARKILPSRAARQVIDNFFGA